MSELASISLGILITDWDNKNKDYLASYIPLITESIKRIDSDILAEKDVQEALREEFKMSIPLDVVGTLLRRCARRGLIERKDRVFTKKPALINQNDFVAKRAIVFEAHNKLTTALCKFAHEMHDIEISATEAENVILNYLEKNQLTILRTARRGTVIPLSSDKVDNSIRYIFGKFLQYIFGNGDKESARYVEILVQATMLANAVYLPVINQAPRRRWYTSLYFDTAFLIYALGYAGPEYKEPAVELLQLSYSTGADLFCFRHNLEEIQGILKLCSSFMKTGQSSYGPVSVSIKHFIEVGYSHSFVDILAQRVEEDLNELNIHIKDTPLTTGEYNRKYQIDEEALETILRGYVKYVNDRALYNDIASISAMHQYWNGDKGHIFEKAPSYFITTNDSLVAATNHFYNKYGILSDSHSFPVLTDHTLTNIMWLRQPTELPDLPRKRIIADSYAATLPTEDLWDKYLQTIDSLVKDGTVSPDDVLLFKATKESEIAIMEATLGETSAITRGTVVDVIRNVRESINQDQIQKAQDEQKRAEEASRLAQQTKDAEQKRKNRIIAKSQRYARKVRIIIERLVLILSFLTAILLFPMELIVPNFSIDLAKLGITVRVILALVTFLFGVIYNAINMFYGTSLNEYVQEIEKSIAEFIEKYWLNLAGFSEDNTLT